MNQLTVTDYVSEEVFIRDPEFAIRQIKESLIRQLAEAIMNEVEFDSTYDAEYRRRIVNASVYISKGGTRIKPKSPYWDTIKLPGVIT